MEPQTKLIDPFVAFLNSILPQKNPTNPVTTTDKPGDRQDVHPLLRKICGQKICAGKYGDSIPIHQSGPSIAELTGSASFGIDLEQNLDKLRGDVKVGSL